MASVVIITLINVWLLLAPPRLFITLFELMRLPFAGRFAIFLAVLVNVMLSVVFEHWGTGFVADSITLVTHLLRSRRRRDGKTYKAVENGHGMD